MRKAFYGFKRAGADYGVRVCKVMVVLKYKRVRDVSQSGYVRGYVLALIYVDDIILAGPQEQVDIAWEELDKALHFGEKSKMYPMLTVYMGVQHELICFLDNGTAVYKVHQTNYKKKVVAEYKQDVKKQHLRASSTPMDERVNWFDGHELPGEMASVCRHYVMALMYVARGSAPEIYHAVTVLARLVTKWTMLQDRQLDKLMCYVDTYDEDGLWCWSNPNDRDVASLLVDWDSDLAGRFDTERSTTGYIVAVEGPSTWFLADWKSRLHDKIDISTPNAELIGGADAMCRSATPTADLLEQITERDWSVRHRTANSTAKLDIDVGWSRAMRFLRRQHRLSISLMHELMNDPEKALEKADTNENRSDVLTKSLGPQKHVEAERLLFIGRGLNDVSDGKHFGRRRL